mmetsp:Transcript_61978/g.134340  ORF Transcript_61978/g.134340 Transcript_61978/m.134340 type:complete len:212 (+) Transcript_61978:2157-2792(+)
MDDICDVPGEEEAEDVEAGRAREYGGRRHEGILNSDPLMEVEVEAKPCRGHIEAEQDGNLDDEVNPPSWRHQDTSRPGRRYIGGIILWDLVVHVPADSAPIGHEGVWLPGIPAQQKAEAGQLACQADKHPGAQEDGEERSQRKAGTFARHMPVPVDVPRQQDVGRQDCHDARAEPYGIGVPHRKDSEHRRYHRRVPDAAQRHRRAWQNSSS